MLNNILKYYTHAKRTALLAYENYTKKIFHVFSVIELLPDEIQDYNIPKEDWQDGKIVRQDKSSGKDQYSFYLIVHDMESVQLALDLFNAPSANGLIDGEQNYFFNRQFTKEPPGDLPLVLPSNLHEANGVALILPRRDSGIFAWVQVDNDRSVEQRFRREEVSSEMKAMSQLTTRWLGFDIWDNAEHLGNIYLAAPNPYFRHLHLSLSENPLGITYRFDMRNGVKERFKVRIVDKHGDNLALDKVYKVNQPFGLIQLPHEPHQVGVTVYNSNDDVVAVQGPATFIKSVHLEMSVKQANFRAFVQDKAGVRQIDVEKYVSLGPTIAGSSPGFNAGVYFKNAERLKPKPDSDFTFYPGGATAEERSQLRTAAKDKIRAILNTAKKQCYLCDPYFAVSDLVDFAFYIQNSGVPIRIINKSGKDFVDRAKAKILLDAIDQYKATPFKGIECRMLHDDLLHDRFIVCDENVWYLGSSFNEFGKRATCVAKVPEADAPRIIKEIKRWFSNDDGKASYSWSIKDYLNSSDNG